MVYTRTVGNLESGKPMDAETLFEIASNTKAMTSTLLARLVQQGKLRWDDPVTKLLPGFQLYDPYVTREFTIRDLVTHRSGLGLGAGDLLWFHSNYSRAEIAYDRTKPDGTPQKRLDISLLRRLGWAPSVALREGLRLAYKDFLASSEKWQTR